MQKNNIKKIIFFINDLKTGGAQNTMKRILFDLRGKYEMSIVTFFELGPVGKELAKNGFEIHVFNQWSQLNAIKTIWHLCRFIHNKKPDYIISFLYFSDMIGGVIGKIAAKNAKVVWNVRNDLLKWGDTSTITFLISRINMCLSYIIPSKIIYCSKVSALSHTKLGYQGKKAIVCENNIDTSIYAFSKEARIRIRKELEIDDQTPLFCMACRYDKIKNIPLFLESIQCFYHKYNRKALFILCGDGISYENKELYTEIERTSIKNRILLKEYITDMPMFLSAVDCIIVTSKSEGSPNIIYEGIASGTYCIVSNLQLDKEKINKNVEVVKVADPCLFAERYYEFTHSFSEKINDRVSNKRESADVYIHNLSKVISYSIEHQIL